MSITHGTRRARRALNDREAEVLDYVARYNISVARAALSTTVRRNCNSKTQKLQTSRARRALNDREAVCRLFYSCCGQQSRAPRSQRP